MGISTRSKVDQRPSFSQNEPNERPSFPPNELNQGPLFPPNEPNERPSLTPNEPNWDFSACDYCLGLLLLEEVMLRVFRLGSISS